MAALLLVAVVAATIGPGAAFNLEPRIAIVKTGPKGSYFGYSVAQHQVPPHIHPAEYLGPKCPEVPL